jgi:hypothetical protein
LRATLLPRKIKQQDDAQAVLYSFVAAGPAVEARHAAARRHPDRASSRQEGVHQKTPTSSVMRLSAADVAVQQAAAVVRLRGREASSKTSSLMSNSYKCEERGDATW